MADDRLTKALHNLSQALDTEGIDWAIAGAIAANFYRDQVRTTMDLDVLLSLTDKTLSVVVDALQTHGWRSVEVIDDWLLRAEHPDAGRVDILVSGTAYETEAITRAQQVALDNDHVYQTLAIEDVLILKLIADRFQDNADVESILATDPDLDWQYMSKWIDEFELSERFQRIENAALARGLLSKKIKRG